MAAPPPFGAAPEIEADDGTHALCERLAEAIVRRRLEAPALFLLEAHLPLQSIAHTGALFLEPLLAPLFGARRWNDLVSLLSRPEALSDLLDAIERRQELRDQQPTPPVDASAAHAGFHAGGA